MSSGPVWVFSFGEVFLSFRWGFFVVVFSGSFFWDLGFGVFFLKNSSQFLPGFPTRTSSTPEAPKDAQWEDGHMDAPVPFPFPGPFSPK